MLFQVIIYSMKLFFFIIGTNTVRLYRFQKKNLHLQQLFFFILLNTFKESIFELNSLYLHN